MVPLLLCPAVPPQIVNISSDITVNEGSSVTLMCLAFGRPEPTVTWRHLSGKGERRCGVWGPACAGCWVQEMPAWQRDWGWQRCGGIYM